MEQFLELLKEFIGELPATCCLLIIVPGIFPFGIILLISRIKNGGYVN